MKTIKTRDAVKRTIRTLHDGKDVSSRMRRSISSAGRSLGHRDEQTKEPTAAEYTSSKMEGSSKAAAVRSVQLGKKSLRAGRKASEKIVTRSVKNVERVTKQTVKTSAKAAKASVKAAKETIKLSQRMAQAAKAIAKATAAFVKAVVKVTVTIVKMIIAATKALVAAIASGGWVAVLVILIICIIILLLVTAYGIFFSDDFGELTMQKVVREIDEEYDAEIARIKREKDHEVVRISGTRAPWKEVLAVYSVKLSMDLKNEAEIQSVNDERKELIREVFWKMNQLDSEVKKVTIEDEETGEKKKVDCLYITIKSLSLDEVAEYYSFTDEEKETMYELLSEGFDSLWIQVIYGISSGSDEIVTVAAGQIGNVGGEKFWSWYGFNERVEWCACFVSWCANECGYIEQDKLPKFSYCDPAIFKERGQWREADYMPKSGDLVFFDWVTDGYQDGEADHVGIVEKVEGGVLYTIEGNRSDACGRYEYDINDPVLFGYIVIE